jgi:hypothetical protein
MLRAHIRLAMHFGSGGELDGKSSWFCLRTYFETKYIVQTQRRFRREFDVPRHGRTLSCNAILKWVDDFSVCDSVVNRSVRPARFSRTPENAEQVTAVMQHSPTRSGRRHAVPFKILSKSLQRICIKFT